MEPSSPIQDIEESPSGTASNRLFYLVLLIGILIGMTVMCLLGYFLWFYGVLNFGEGGCPTAEDLCPATITLEAPPAIDGTDVPPLTETPLPSGGGDPAVVDTATLDSAAATATQACADFENQFPGTPCP